MERKRSPKIIRTPKFRIPIGEAVKNADGHYSLKIKKPKSPEIEEVTLDQLIKMVLSEAE